MRAMRVKRGKRFFTSKRGDVNHKIILTLASLLIVAIVGLLLMERIGALANNTAFYRYYIAFDTGLLMTSLYSSPANLVYTYTPINGIDLPFVITLTSSKVSAGILGERLRSKYYYMEDLSVVPVRVAEVSLSEVSVFYKSGQIISTNPNDINMLQKTCPRLWIDEPNWKSEKKIFMNVTVLSSSEGSTHEEESAKKIFLDSIVDSIEKTHAIKLVSINPDIFIGFVDAGSFDKILRVYIDINSEKLLESRTLACNILNELVMSSEGISAVQIIPLHPGALQDSDPLKALDSEAEIRIIIESGVFNEETSAAEIVADSVINGLESYFGYLLRESRSGFSYDWAGLSYTNIATITDTEAQDTTQTERSQENPTQPEQQESQEASEEQQEELQGELQTEEQQIEELQIDEIPNEYETDQE